MSAPRDPAVQRAHARKAATERHHGPDAAPTRAAAEALAAEVERVTLDRHVNVLVASWHRATPEQKARLRRLFNPVG